MSILRKLKTSNLIRLNEIHFKCIDDIRADCFSILLGREFHGSFHRPPTDLSDHRIWLAPAFLVGGTGHPDWIGPWHAAAFLDEVGPCTCHPHRWHPAAHDRRATGFPVQGFSEQPCRFELPSM